MEVHPTDRPSPGYSNEPKAIAHIRVASGVRTRVRRIGFSRAGPWAKLMKPMLPADTFLNLGPALGFSLYSQVPSVSAIFSLYTSFSAITMLFRTILNEVVPERIREYVALKVVDFFSSYFQSNFTVVIEERWEFAENQTFRAAEVYLPTRLAGLSTSELLVGSSDLKNPAAEPKFGIPVNTKIIDELEGIRFEWTLHSVETKKYCREKRCGEEKIIIFTTNHKEKLDPTLLRPGRMDVHILMDNCTPFVFKKLVALYLKINEYVLFDPIEKLVLEVSATPAEVTQQLMASKDADIAFKGLLEFLETKKIKKEEDSKVEEAAPPLVKSFPTPLHFQLQNGVMARITPFME
ncbi:hypothetical protein YC2023_046140 [Brassica napus]